MDNLYIKALKDSAISIDGTYISDIPNGNPLDINVVDQNDIGITPLSGTVSGGVATVKIDIPPCLDATVTLNGNVFITVPSGATEDITLIKETGGVIIPTLVVGSTITIEDKLIWLLNFDDEDDTFKINVTTDNIGTFTSGVSTNIGTFYYSTDDVTFTTVTYPFTPSLGNAWFRRSNYVGAGTQKMTGL